MQTVYYVVQGNSTEQSVEKFLKSDGSNESY